MSSPVTRSPQMFLYRESVDATDTLPEIRETAGVNCGNYNKLLVNVIPVGDANPTVTVLVWSEKAGRYIQTAPATEITGVGANTPFSFVFEAHGRKIFIAVTTLTTGTVSIEVAAAEMDHDLS